jgi:hypothetical protein
MRRDWQLIGFVRTPLTAPDVAVDEAAPVGTIEGAASMMTALVLVEVRPTLSVAT